MIYLMMDKNREYNLVKVGVTRKLDVRRSNYKSHNPLAIMRSSCAGTEEKEIRCHTKLKEIGQRVKGTEWFIVNNSIFTELYNKGLGYFFPKHSPIYFNESF